MRMAPQQTMTSRDARSTRREEEEAAEEAEEGREASAAARPWAGALATSTASHRRRSASSTSRRASQWSISRSAAGRAPQTLPQFCEGVGTGVGSLLLSSSSTHTAFGQPAALFAKYKYVPRRNKAALNKTPRPTWLRTKPVTSGLPLLQFMVLSMVLRCCARQPRAAALLPGAREAPNDSKPNRCGTQGTGNAAQKSQLACLSRVSYMPLAHAQLASPASLRRFDSTRAKSRISTAESARRRTLRT